MADLLAQKVLITDLSRYTRVFDLSQAPDMVGLPSGHIPREELRTITPGSSFEIKGKRYFLLPCDLHDFILNGLKRNTQIIYPKDAGYLLLKMDIAPGKRIGEAGTGSGALTSIFSRFVGAEGHVYTYEHDIGLVNHAVKNLKLDSEGTNVTITHRSLEQGIDQQGLDAFFLDVREPWNFIRIIYDAIKPGGHLGFLIPTTNQVSKLLQSLIYFDIWITEITEIFMRKYKNVPGRLRPEDRMIAHTGYLVFARKLAPGSYAPHRQELPYHEEDEDMSEPS
jgi:tRNA (adenine57-N1/adenine58-N1)-methyltransferase catalytic subunit